jgi:hypothetical protein
MNNNVINQTPYLPTSRNFPEELEQLTVEVNKSYVDIANAVNMRTIGLYPGGRPALTGNSFFLNGNQRQQTLRQVYTFTSAGSINTGIRDDFTPGFVAIYGTFTDGTNWYPLPYVDVIAANNQINVIIEPGSPSWNIVITAGSGAPPTISSGYVVLEWLSNV